MKALICNNVQTLLVEGEYKDGNMNKTTCVLCVGIGTIMWLLTQLLPFHSLFFPFSFLRNRFLSRSKKKIQAL